MRGPSYEPKACEARGCDRVFMPDRVTARYCSAPCRWRSKNAERRRARERAAYATDPALRERKVLDATAAKAEKKALVQALKEAPCADCGERYPYYVMDFDHVRGAKRGDVGAMLAQGYALKTILDEVAKCDVVCANCHRERTFTRLGVGVI